MAGFRIEGNTSGNVAEVDANNNLKTTLPAVRSQAGYAVSLFENDAGTLTGTPTRRSPRVSQDNRLGVGVDTILFADNFNATAQNTALWRHVFVTMTATVSGGSLLLNANSTLTTATGVSQATWQQFPLNAAGGLRYSAIAQFTASPLTNQVVEFGLFPQGTGIVAPVEGIFFRYTSAGLIGVLNYNGTETTTGVLLATGSVTDSQAYEFGIRIDMRGIEFYRDDVKLGSLSIPSANGFPYMQTALPAAHMFRNSGTVTGAPVMQAKISNVCVLQRDLNTNKHWQHQMARQGLMAYQGQNGNTMGSTALYTNSLAPGAGAAMTNTTAALGTGLGGQFAALPTLAANTDGIVCSFQNPAGSINITPRQLVITGVKVQSVVTTALTGGPCIYFYSLAFGHTAVSLATTETASMATATTKAPRRIALGVESIAATAAVGVVGSANGISMAFDSPIVVNPGEFIAIVAKNVGTVTTLGVVTFLVTFAGYWE